MFISFFRICQKRKPNEIIKVTMIVWKRVGFHNGKRQKYMKYQRPLKVTTSEERVEEGSLPDGKHILPIKIQSEIAPKATRQKSRVWV